MARRVKAGDELPAFIRKTDLETWNRFAAVNEEFVPHHMDDDAGRASGFEGAIGMGNLQWSYFHNLLREWIGSPGAGRIVSVSCKFEGANLRGTTLTIGGTVVSVEDESDRQRVTIELSSQDDRGSTLARGEAVVLIGAAAAS